MKTTIDFPIRLRIHELMKQHLKQIALPSAEHTKGIWKYDAGFSDSQIATIIGGKCAANHVQYVRMASFGFLERKIPDAQAALNSKGERVARLVIERFNQLLEEVGSQAVKHITEADIAAALKG